MLREGVYKFYLWQKQSRLVIQRPGDPGTKRELAWVAHEKITVRRKQTKV